MQKYQNVAQDGLGNVIQGMNATVFLNGTQTLASLFSDAAGTTPITNPVVTDALGNFIFYATNGRYDVQLSRSGLPTTILTDIILFDPFGGGPPPPPLVAAQVFFGGTGGALTQDANFFWDNVNKRLNIGNGAATLDTRLVLNGGANAVKGAVINFQRGGASKGFFGTEDLILGDGADGLALQAVNEFKVARGGTTVPVFQTTAGGIVTTGSSIPQLLFVPTSGSTKQAQLQQVADVLNINDQGGSNRLIVNLNTGQVSVPTSINTPQVGNESGTTALRANGATAIQFSSSAFNPNADLSMTLGLNTLRYGALFALAIDSGNTSSLSLRTSNGVVQAVIDHVNSAVTAVHLNGSATGGNANVSGQGETNTGLNLISSGSGSIQFQSASGITTQFQVLHTASANRNAIVTGSNGGSPKIDSSAGPFSIFASGVVAIVCGQSSVGQVQFPGIGTTASAANAFLDNAASNNLLRSTSSMRYKRDIAGLVDADLLALDQVRVVRYRSAAPADDQERFHYGMLAEDVARVNPFLVTTGKLAVAENVEVDVPDWVQYERFIPLLIEQGRRDRARIKALEVAVFKN